VNFVDPSGLVWQDIGLTALKNVAGGIDSFTGGFTGWVAEGINSMIYGESAATATTAAMENTVSAKVIEYVDYINPKGLVKNLVKEGIKSLKKGLRVKGKKKKKKCKDPKGKKTEAKMDLHYLVRGYKKISKTKYHGIDGVYKHRITGKYVVGEAKFNTSKLGRTVDGNQQMSKDWINKRLEAQVDRKDIKAMKKGYKKEVFHVDKNCKKSKRAVKDVNSKNVKLGPKVPVKIL